MPLSLIDGLTRAHLSFRAEALGNGSRLEATLPCAPPPAGRAR